MLVGLLLSVMFWLRIVGVLSDVLFFLLVLVVVFLLVWVFFCSMMVRMLFM